MSTHDPFSATLYNDFSTTDDQADSLNSSALSIQKRVRALKIAALAADDPIDKIDILADMIAATAALASLPIAYDISSRDIADNAMKLL